MEEDAMELITAEGRKQGRMKTSKLLEEAKRATAARGLTDRKPAGVTVEGMGRTRMEAGAIRGRTALSDRRLFGSTRGRTATHQRSTKLHNPTTEAEKHRRRWNPSSRG